MTEPALLLHLQVTAQHHTVAMDRAHKGEGERRIETRVSIQESH